MTLADRVEQAGGPDRELDAEIEALFTNANGTSPLKFFRHQIVSGNHRPLRFTASLDAAMTPLPEGWRVREVTQHIELTQWYAQIESPDCVSYSATASTEVLTRLAAILRAHEQGGEGDD